MFRAATRSFKLGQARPSAPKMDKRIIVPILACGYAVIGSPVLMYLTRPSGSVSLEALLESHLENRLIWPGMAAIALILVARNFSKFTVPLHIKWLLAYLALAGMSVVWAFKPDISFVRYVSQVMIVMSIVLPAMLAARSTDMMYGLFLCYALASILNALFVLNQDPLVIEGTVVGYPGYFAFKGTLGECAAIAFILSLREILNAGARRVLAVTILVIDIWLMLVSESKGALGMAFIAPFLALLTLIVTKKARISPATVVLSALFCFVVFSAATGFTMNRLSYYIYNNYTFSARTVIWDFAESEIARRPFFGWGFQSFWLAGTDAPSIVDAGGWVRNMPSAHSGYLDIKLETGYVGYLIFLCFLVATLHAIGRVADRDRLRAWLLLSLALFVILTNFLETVWTRGAEPLWVLFVVVAAEIGRYSMPVRTAVDAPARKMSWRRRPFVGKSRTVSIGQRP
jgi:exopolysaccharide production protein ExoQ